LHFIGLNSIQFNSIQFKSIQFPTEPTEPTEPTYYLEKYNGASSPPFPALALSLLHKVGIWRGGSPLTAQALCSALKAAGI